MDREFDQYTVEEIITLKQGYLAEKAKYEAQYARLIACIGMQALRPCKQQPIMLEWEPVKSEWLASHVVYTDIRAYGSSPENALTAFDIFWVKGKNE